MKIEDKELKAIKARIAQNGGVERCAFSNAKISIRTNNKPIQVNNINLNNIKDTNSMEKRTQNKQVQEQTNENLLHRAIKQAYNGKGFTSDIEQINDLGKRLGGQGNITIPTNELRAINIGKASSFDAALKVQEVVVKPTNNIFERLGATKIEGLVTNINYPYITQDNVQFNAVGYDPQEMKFGNIELKPKRIVALCSYSVDLVNTTNVDVQNAFVTDLLSSIEQAFEKALLSDTKETIDLPKGLFNGVTPTNVTSYKDLVEMEYQATTKDMANLTYLCSSKAAKALKLMTNGNCPVLCNGMINGIRVIETNNVQEGYMCLIDASKLVIGDWGMTDIVIDKVTHIAEGYIELSINTFKNGCLKNPSQIVVGKVA
ncbi:hypothetical protein HMPREF0653_00943 [Prevotella disiens JCM 6334 = ATCC 29426]|uniref:Predicted phage phi-C31 gp36 major capsid-like protein n=2 Tax=Prevotella disiens TaxID=28130 RepID=A0A379E0G1_9BACT|nr:phage major capsid protein [Prevotella disiens]ERJ78585.1 hypothetical protein HMPREF0653_00943 [Prevotella disiens JCM 6334 = ATCC 29426]SUB86145.1 Predicted phage phi-C31 gp36 major capsid-like protein [Prevotella disiens]